MEKSAAKTYKDPALNKLIQEKALWNRQVSSLINDIIHFKKSMNGWPSKFYKERTRLTQPIPVDLSSILGKMTGEFQDIASQGNSILREQSDFAKNHLARKGNQALDKLEKMQGPENAPAAKQGPDLSQQLGKGLAAKEESYLVKLGTALEVKYELEAMASNPISRFVTRLFNPKFGFGEKARVRRIRMTMLDNCVKSYKELKKLHNEIVKSSKSSILSSHKMMTLVWNYWNAVNRYFSTYKSIRPEIAKEDGGIIEAPALRSERSEEQKEQSNEEAREQGHDPEESPPVDEVPLLKFERAKNLIKDTVNFGARLKSPKGTTAELTTLVDTLTSLPKKDIFNGIMKSNIDEVYRKALTNLNQELGTNGISFKDVAKQLTQKAAQPKVVEAQLGRWIGKSRHQLIPGATSGPRVEVYNFISQIKKDLNTVMDLLEKGFDEVAITAALAQVNREMISLRTMMRSLYYSEKPEEQSTPFF